jgi:hypothetical protein
LREGLALCQEAELAFQIFLKRKRARSRLHAGMYRRGIGADGTPDSENGRYSFYPVADGVLRLDTVSVRSRNAAGPMPAGPAGRTDERSALNLQGETATLKKQLLARGLPIPGAPGPSIATADPELKLPSDADVDKVIFLS